MYLAENNTVIEKSLKIDKLSPHVMHGLDIFRRTK